MRYTTLCYIENPAGEYLMLHRVKKENDCNRDKWIGIGGKFEDGESPEEWVPLSRHRHLCVRPVRDGIHAPVHR